MGKGQRFSIKVTHDFFSEDGKTLGEDMGLSVLDDEPLIQWERFQEHRPEIGPDQVAGAQGVVVLAPRVTAQTVSAVEDLLAIGRFGAGFDAVDIPACTAAGVAVMNTPGAVDRPVGEATVGWMIALSHHTRIKDMLVRTGQWNSRTDYSGSELRDKTFGAVGLGGIARKTLELLQGFGMNPPIAHDPLVDEAAASKLGVRLVALHELLAQADFVSVHCPLMPQTEGLIGADELALMKPGAFLLNTARGGIVDEDALYDTLKNKRIAGAAIDVFVGEPITEPHRFGELENVLLAPHAIAWTHELFRDIGRSVFRSMVELAHGKRPGPVLNPEVFDRPSFQEKWRRLRIS